MSRIKNELQKIASKWQEIEHFLEETSYLADCNYYSVQNVLYRVRPSSIKTLLKFGYIGIDMTFTAHNQVKYLKKRDFDYSEYQAKRTVGYFKQSPQHGLINRRFSTRRRADNVA